MKLRLLFLLFISVQSFAQQKVLSVFSLNRDQVVQLFSNQTINFNPSFFLGKKVTDDTVQIYFASNGTLQGKWQKKFPENTVEKDQGIWSVESDGQQCVKWQSWGNECMYYYPFKDGYLLISANDTQVMYLPRDQFSSGNSIIN